MSCGVVKELSTVVLTLMHQLAQQIEEGILKLAKYIDFSEGTVGQIEVNPGHCHAVACYVVFCCAAACCACSAMLPG